MKELILSQQYAVVALNGLESLHPSMAKEAVLRAIAAAKVLEEILEIKGNIALEPVQDAVDINGDMVIDDETFLTALKEAVNSAKSLNKREGKKVESEMYALLEADGLMERIPDILGCDMNYYTSGIELKAYRSDERTYVGLREGLRAEVLEDGPITLESAVLLWLHRESGCIHDLFSVEEQNRVQSRMVELSVSGDIYRGLWESEFHNGMEAFAGRFLKSKKNMFKNPYLEGVNLLFPYMERRQAIFIDCVIFHTTVKERRIAAMEHLCKMGHYVEEVKNGSETLLKVDNTYYRIFPKTVIGAGYKVRVPIQGVELVPVYW